MIIRFGIAYVPLFGLILGCIATTERIRASYVRYNFPLLHTLNGSTICTAMNRPLLLLTNQLLYTSSIKPTRTVVVLSSRPLVPGHAHLPLTKSFAQYHDLPCSPINLICKHGISPPSNGVSSLFLLIRSRSSIRSPSPSSSLSASKLLFRLLLL